MKKNKLWWSLLITLMLPLSFAITSCDDDDKSSGGSSSNKLTRTAWYGADNQGELYSMEFFDEDGFALIQQGTYTGCEGDYSVSSGKISFRNVYNWGSKNLIKNGTYEYKIQGRRGDRELVIYDVLPGKNELYLEEVDFTGSGSDYDGSDDGWDFDW